MKKRRLSSRSKTSARSRYTSFFPFIDSRIIPDIISFKCVKGPARLFLQLEIILALLVLIGSCAVIMSKYW